MPDHHPTFRGATRVTVAVVALALAGCGTVPPPAGSASPSSTASATPSAVASAAPSVSPSTPSPRGPQPSPSASTPTAVPSGPVLAVYGDGLRLSGSTLTFTTLHWYTSKAAKARCKVKHIKSETEWCNDYYYERTSQRRTVSVSTQTAIRVLTDQPKLIPATPDRLAAAIKEDVWPNFRIWAKSGQATRIDQVFTP